MSVARCREINARLRAAGITVHEWPGWDRRGNGQSSAYEGALIHHTGGPSGMALPGTAVGNLLVNGRRDLAGPLCNYAGNADGSITVIAAHPANHAGASGGRSMGPLPTTRLFNKRVLGLEIVYPGTSPMTDAQYRTARIWARIVTNVCGNGDIQRARAHAETSITGKWDPGHAGNKTIDMTSFRAQALTASEGDMQADEREWLHTCYTELTQRLTILETNYVDTMAGFARNACRDSYAARVGVEAANVQLATLQGTLSDNDAKILAAIRLVSRADVDENSIAAALAPLLAPLVQAGATTEQLEAAVRAAFADAGRQA
jgi:hypothetical protein